MVLRLAEMMHGAMGAIIRILAARGSTYKGKLANHACALFLSAEGIVHGATKAYSPKK